MSPAKSASPTASRDRLAHLAGDDLAELLRALLVQVADLADQRRALGDGGGLRPRFVGGVGPADRLAQRVVGDRRVLLDRLPGGGIDYGVIAHLAPSQLKLGRSSEPTRSPGSAIADLYRPRRVTTPLRPRAREQATAAEPGLLHRQQVVAGGDAGAAGGDDLGGVVDGEAGAQVGEPGAGGRRRRGSRGRGRCARRGCGRGAGRGRRGRRRSARPAARRSRCRRSRRSPRPRRSRRGARRARGGR